jgi:hypothetical protein
MVCRTIRKEPTDEKPPPVLRHLSGFIVAGKKTDESRYVIDKREGQL